MLRKTKKMNNPRDRTDSYEEDVRNEVPREAEETDWDDDTVDAIEDDPFYEPYLENEQLMNIGRILRYELGRTEEGIYMAEEEEEEDSDSEGPPVNTRVVPESESLPPAPPSSSPASVSTEEGAVAQDPDKLSPADFEGLPRYRLAFMCVRYFEWTGIRNIATASSIPNEVLMRALCQIPRGRVVPDCAICSYPLWDALETKCCSQPLCIHCVNRCAECPYCRPAEY